MKVCEASDLDNLPRIHYLLSLYYSYLKREDLARAFALQAWSQVENKVHPIKPAIVRRLE